MESFSFVVSAFPHLAINHILPSASDVVQEGASCLALLCKVHVVSTVSSGGGVGRVPHQPGAGLCTQKLDPRVMMDEVDAVFFSSSSFFMLSENLSSDCSHYPTHLLPST